VEVIFCSSDRDEDAFKEYSGDMPWLALPYSKREFKEELSSMFGVSGIPIVGDLQQRWHKVQFGWPWCFDGGDTVD